MAVAAVAAVDIVAVFVVGGVIVIASAVVGGTPVVTVTVVVDGGATDEISRASVISWMTPAVAPEVDSS